MYSFDLIYLKIVFKLLRLLTHTFFFLHLLSIFPYEDFQVIFTKECT